MLLGIPQFTIAAPQLTADSTFVFPFNRWNWPGATPSVVTGGIIGSYTLANTQLQQRSKVMRLAVGGTENPNSAQAVAIKSDLAAPYRINSFCLVSHNMSKESTFRVEFSNAADFSILKYDSGFIPVWEASFIDSGIYAEEIDSDGQPSAEMIAMLKYCGNNPRVVRWIVFDEIAARYVRVSFNDPASSDGYIELAYIYVGLCVPITPGFIYGWTLTPVNYARTRRSASGSLWTDMLYRQIVASATFPAQRQDVSLAFWNIFSQYVGRKREFIIAFQPEGLSKKFWYTLYGRFRQPPQLAHVATGAMSVSFEVEELPG